ncbi:hypothetical protein D9757_013705 [Collybiopsis confluens]|uniref:Uncharacterized protein n=1 Tax=Collybiopsis confluens TaxID=2823264 RepID=A0A8H5D4P3_9AGAR|nr:hypothetical protein D9757_013705 [Collybiopsis confluens]
MSASSDSAGFPLEESYYYGIIFSSLIYGVQLTMCVLSTYIYTTKRGQGKIYVMLGLAMMFFRTIGFFPNVVLLNFMWINHRDYPGGPLAYVAANTSVWWQVLGNLASQITFFIADAILVFRCYVIWNSDWRIIVFPALTYLTSVAMALVLTVETAIPGSNFFAGIQVNFGIAWATFSVVTNVVVTSLISLKLIRARHQLKELLPNDEESLRTYTGPVAILIESALPYSILGIVWAIMYGKDNVSAPALSMIWALTPQFIIFRVTTGRAWASNTMSTVASALQFQHTSGKTGTTATTATTTTTTTTTSPNGRTARVRRQDVIDLDDILGSDKSNKSEFGEAV